VQVLEGDEVMLISDMGTLVRTRADEVSVQRRYSQGVRLINLRGEEQLNSVARIVESNAGNGNGNENGDGNENGNGGGNENANGGGNENANEERN